MQNTDVRVTDANAAERFLASQFMQSVSPSISPALRVHPICSKSLDDVLQHIRATDVHRQGIRGKDVHIAIVDTGICGMRKEFPPEKQSPLSFTIGPNRRPTAQDDSWFVNGTHASMTACIAAATKVAGGIYDGVAPDATLISCRVPDVDETYLIPAYERLIDYVKQGKVGRLVINNSYGPRGSDSQAITRFIDIVKEAVALGVVVVFSAGNRSVVKSRAASPSLDSPPGIWGVNSLAEVITVGTVDQDDDMNKPLAPPFLSGHINSGRGPGQFDREKPDCVAPTYGRVMSGSGEMCGAWWGTSGAAPQVAGLAALMLEKDPTLAPDRIKQIIKQTCVRLPHLGPTCGGAGRIDCQKAVQAVT